MGRISTLFSFNERPREAGEAYIALLAAARNPFFFERCSVPDTLDGRFELTVLHLALLQHRLRAIPDAENFALGVTEAFFADMERALRELGVLYPDKRIKKMGDAYAGRLNAYTQAFSDCEALKAALARNLYGTVNDGEVAVLETMATIVMQLHEDIARATDDTLLAGSYAWPAPEALG